MNPNYADQFCDWLLETGYTHCFFVAGGNIMHLLNSARTRFVCIPVIHEVSSVIAAEYFNETGMGNKAFALVTAGPGLTNAMTGIAGAWLESREVLVVGGQVKSTDLASGGVRQRGIQEIDGIALARPITKAVKRVERPMPKKEIMEHLALASSGRPGPVFLEFCLDAQAAPALTQEWDEEEGVRNILGSTEELVDIEIDLIVELIRSSKRPVWLIGGGTSREVFDRNLGWLEDLGVPIMTTWNASDRIDSDHPLFWGRPNTWGQRSANVLIQQADLIISVGTRLGLQQTGFNWQSFGKQANIVQVDIDPAELHKGHPRIDLAHLCDADRFLAAIQAKVTDLGTKELHEWIDFGAEVRRKLPIAEESNITGEGYTSPYSFADELSKAMRSEDILVPCSSGGAFTTIMQGFRQKRGQRIVTNKGLASMGYGLAGALGASFANPNSRIILIEGDGGFAQNLQELGTVSINKLPVKIFLYENGGYASIRMTQENYFNGEFVGCDRTTGLGLPNWRGVLESFGIDVVELDTRGLERPDVVSAFNSPNPVVFIVPIDPRQTYFPKITSRINADGMMESNPLHLMSPALESDLAKVVFRYLTEVGDHEF